MTEYDPLKDDGLTNEQRTIRQIYLAGPFFNEEQVREISMVEGLLKEHGFTYFSPRKECRYHPGDPEVVAERAKWLNKFHIVHCEYVLAGLSYPDMGTAWELGYADGINQPRIGWVSDPLLGLNLMIRGTVHLLIPFGSVGVMLGYLKDRERKKRWTTTHSTGRVRLLTTLDDDFSVYWKGKME